MLCLCVWQANVRSRIEMMISSCLICYKECDLLTLLWMRYGMGEPC